MWKRHGEFIEGCDSVVFRFDAIHVTKRNTCEKTLETKRVFKNGAIR